MYTSSQIINPQSRQSTHKSVNRDNIIKKILDTIDKIHEVEPTCTIHIEWVPGHTNVEDNEQADQAAKATVTSRISQHKNKIGPKSINKAHGEEQMGYRMANGQRKGYGPRVTGGRTSIDATRV